MIAHFRSAAAMLFVALTVSLAAAPREGVRGLPFIRTYALDEIGSVPRGLRLGFDAFGRVAVMYDGTYSVLNDSAWVERVDLSGEHRILMTTVRVVEGRYLYGGRGSWGFVEQTPEGRMRARPLVPPDAPAWTTVTAFNEILPGARGAYFYELNGVVYWDYAKQRHAFFELPRVSFMFRLGTRAFVSCQDGNLREFGDDDTLMIVTPEGSQGAVFNRAARLDENHVLLCTIDNRLLVFDGQTMTPWEPQQRHKLQGGISSLCALVDGGVALGIEGKGLFLVGADGSLRWALSSPEFSRITGLAANEPGVVWASGENAVRKILYDSPLTEFTQQLGLTVFWPRLAIWQDKIVVFSSPRVYTLEPGEAGAPARFKVIGAPEGGAGSLATAGPHLLVGNATGVFALGPDLTFKPVAQLKNVHKIEFISPDTCVAIGSREIAAFQFRDGKWAECAPRIDGVGDAPIRTKMRRALWVEMGADLVARVTLKEGKLTLDRIRLPWSGGQWTNLGFVGDIVVISGSVGHRAFYDESRETLVEAPALRDLLARSPYWIARIATDSAGRLWATHTKGAVLFTPSGGDFAMDSTTFELRHDSYPEITILPDDDIWITSGRSLYHVEPETRRAADTARPAFVSFFADRLNREFLPPVPGAAIPRLALDDNSLAFRIFSGTYAWRYPPVYDYRLGESEPWNRVDAGLLMRFPKLSDGAYRLQVRPAAAGANGDRTLVADFVINPPWFRSPPAYGGYLAVLTLGIAGLVRWTNRLSRRRNEELRRLVRERTRQLEETAEKLRDETRNAATLEERSRLAGEIHDSLGQGFHGLMLQLESIGTLGDCPPRVARSLDIARSLVAQCRKEVRHAVWAMRSPVLETVDLATALKHIATQTADESREVSVIVKGEPRDLGPSIEHHFLRVGQEAITNVIEHARASRLWVRLNYSEACLQLEIEDNGCGFEEFPRQGRSPTHFGLLSMRDRVKKMGGTIDIRSAPGRGTCVSISIPLDTPAIR